MIKTNIMYYTRFDDDNNNNDESDEKCCFHKMNEHGHYSEITLVSSVYGQRRVQFSMTLQQHNWHTFKQMDILI